LRRECFETPLRAEAFAAARAFSRLRRHELLVGCLIIERTMDERSAAYGRNPNLGERA
jgi:hypothetical protein